MHIDKSQLCGIIIQLGGDMQTKICRLNYRQNEYKFNLAAISESDWVNFAHDSMLELGERDNNLVLNGIKAVIRNNKAKVKLFYQDSAYHQLEYHLDEFGRASKNYRDVISSLFQGVMSKIYGAEYDAALEKKLGSTKTNTQN